MAEALSEGWNPRRTALEIAGRIDKVSGRRVGGVLGLSSDLEEHVRRARIELADPSGMRRFLTRSLRDRRYDGRVRLAIAEGRKLSQADYDLLVSRYSDRLLKYRAERVARTESTAALNAGRLEGMRQAVDAGRLRQDQVKKRWRSALDKRTRDTHIGMHNQVVPFDKPFQSPRGALLMYPSDSALGAGPSEVVNCRCTFEFEVSF